MNVSSIQTTQTEEEKIPSIAAYSDFPAPFFSQKNNKFFLEYQFSKIASSQEKQLICDYLTEIQEKFLASPSSQKTFIQKFATLDSTFLSSVSDKRSNWQALITFIEKIHQNQNNESEKESVMKIRSLTHLTWIKAVKDFLE